MINNGARPISDWQIAVAVRGGSVVAVVNAAGIVVKGILLLEPARDSPPVAAGGGVLDVSFIAVGGRPDPGACAFNQIPCH